MSEKRNVPELRFSGFDSSIWKHTALGEVCEMNPKSPSLPDNFVYIDLESVSGGRLLKEDHIEIHDAPSRAQRLLAKNDVIFQTVRPYQKNNLIFTKDGDYVASTGYAQLRPRENPSFLFQQIHTNRFVNDVLKRCTGTSYPAISSSDLGEVTFSIPSLPEQQKIAEFLTTVDKRIELLQAKKEKLKAYKKGVMQQIFSQKLRFKADDGSNFPDWEEKKLGEMAKIFSGGTPTSSKPEFYEGSIPFIRSGEINSTETELFITDKALEKSTAKMVEKGDLLLAIYGATSGEVGISKIDGAINQAILCIRWHGKNAFLGNWLKLNKETLTKKYLQGGQGNLSGEIVKSYVIPVPTLEEQKKIVAFLTSLDSSIETLEKQINQTQTWKKGLLQKMFV